MTNDLISREAALKAIRAYANSKAVNEGLETANNILRTVQVIEAAPAVDAAPVVHGRWKTQVTSPCCSICNYVARYWWRFCPNCGAKMDKEADNAQG